MIKTLTKALVLVLSMMLLATAPAQALSGRGYDNTNPSKSYDGKPACNQNSSRIASYSFRDDHTGRVIPNAVLEVYYSSSCGTNWTRVVNNNTNYTGYIYQEIRSGAGGYEEERDRGYTGPYYSMQVYAPGTTWIKFRAVLSNEGRSASTGFNTL